MDLSIQLLITAALIALNAGFVLAEYSMVKARAARMELLARKGSLPAQRVQVIQHNLELYLSAVQLGITMVSLGLGWVGEPAVARALEPYVDKLPYLADPGVTKGVSFGIAFALITFFHIVLGELVPRGLVLQRAEGIALWAALPLTLFERIFRPPVVLMAGAAQKVLSLFRSKADGAEGHLTEEEMRIMLGSSEEAAGFSLERLMLLENIFDFGTAKVSEAMVPQYKVAYLSMAKSWEENLAVIKQRRFSRYPLCETDLDTVFGLVHVKDILLAGTQNAPDLRAMRRDIVEVAPGESLQKLLKTFPDRGIQMAVVRNATGGVAGIVTLEDILEEIVGEIHDEYDLPQAWSLMDVLVPAAVKIGYDTQDREQLVRQMVAKLKESNPALDADEAVRVVWDREAKFSSAVGHGVAVPHGRMANLDKPLVALARAKTSFAFPAPDKVPVRLAFLILTPSSSPVAQLKILARIASLVSNENLRRRLLRAKTEEHLLDILRTADTVLASP